MRILINIIVIISLLISTSGILISEHYCKNHLVSVSFFSTADNCCKGDCNSCKNIAHAFKIKTKFIPSQSINCSLNNSFTSFSSLLNTYIIDVISLNHSTPFISFKPPPGKFSEPVYFSKLRL